MIKVDYFSKLKEEYPHLSDSKIDDVILSAKEILIHLLYPSFLEVSEEKQNIAFRTYQYWILRCCKEIISRKGMENAISYKENGISISFDSTHLSKSLINEIKPVIGIL